ncbi:MAG: heme-binding domain-containing protein [Deltaproteobacteria bacterium]
MGRARVFIRRGLLVIVGLFLIAQVIPYGRAHTNPPIVAEPKWDSPATRALAKRACFDCHSNETTWPWYSHVAPTSWFLQSHVDDGRQRLNFSEWNKPYRAASKASREIKSGGMPLTSYLLMHADAHLSETEKADLERGLDASLGSAAPK